MGASFKTDRCAEFVDPAFTQQYSVKNLKNLNNGINMFNYQMEYGGTNWGWTRSPSSGFASYDYGGHQGCGVRAGFNTCAPLSVNVASVQNGRHIRHEWSAGLEV